jgi:hypothetical protein
VLWTLLWGAAGAWLYRRFTTTTPESGEPD